MPGNMPPQAPHLYARNACLASPLIQRLRRLCAPTARRAITLLYPETACARSVRTTPTKTRLPRHFALTALPASAQLTTGHLTVTLTYPTAGLHPQVNHRQHPPLNPRDLLQVSPPTLLVLPPPGPPPHPQGSHPLALPFTSYPQTHYQAKIRSNNWVPTHGPSASAPSLSLRSAAAVWAVYSSIEEGKDRSRRP